MSASVTQVDTVASSTTIARSAQERSRLYKAQLTGDKIRLLRLLPGSGNARIQCHLTEVAIVNSPPYETLSYVWGDANVTEPILCNGETLHVTANLANALRRIRAGISKGQPKDGTDNADKSLRNINVIRRTDASPSSPLLWVDAICINQADIVERSHQVPLMGAIYSRAQRVIAWLGDVDITADQRAAIVVVVELFEVILLTRTCYEEPVSSELDLTNENFEQLMSERGYTDKREVWTAVSFLFKSAWFTRIWCVQEAILACEMTILFNFGEFRPVVIQAFAAWLLLKCFSNQWSPPPLGYVLPNITEARNRLARGYKDSSNILTYLNIYSRLSATDPKDKIYGILGLASDEVIKVDYEKSTLQVYSAFVLSQLARGMQVFSHVYHPAELGGLDGFPSWVPRWDQANSKYRLYDYPRDNTLSRRRQSPDLDLGLAHAGILRLPGLFCDTVVGTVYVRFDPEHLVHGKIVDTGQHFLHFLIDLWNETQPLDSAGNFSDTALAYSLGLNLTGGHMGLHAMVDDLTKPEQFHFLCCFLATIKQFIPSGLDWIDLEGANVDVFQGLMTLYCHDRRLFRTKRGWLGLGPRCMRPDDLLVVLHGGPMPYILRPAGDGKFLFMGECYVSAIARGEVYDIAGTDGIEERVFNLI